MKSHLKTNIKDRGLNLKLGTAYLKSFKSSLQSHSFWITLHITNIWTEFSLFIKMLLFFVLSMIFFVFYVVYRYLCWMFCLWFFWLSTMFTELLHTPLLYHFSMTSLISRIVYSSIICLCYFPKFSPSNNSFSPPGLPSLGKKQDEGNK